MAAGAGARARRGLRSAGAVRRLRLDRARVRVRGRPTGGLRGAAGGHACRRARSRRVPRRALPLRHRRIGDAGHRPPVPAPLQPVALRSPHGRLRHRQPVPAPAWDETRCPAAPVVRRRLCGAAAARLLVPARGLWIGTPRPAPDVGRSGSDDQPSRNSRRSRRCATTTARRPRGSEQPRRRRSRRAPFGQRLFFDPALSGPLLEGDNDGSTATLGRQGEAGRVSCAGCHVPDSGFVDTRSPHQQISLARAVDARRTPTLLEVAFAPLYNWDGRRDSLWNQAIGVMESEQRVQLGTAVRRAPDLRTAPRPSTKRSSARCRRSTTPRASRSSRPTQAGCVEQQDEHGRRSTTAAASPATAPTTTGWRPPTRRGHRGDGERRQGDRRLRAPAALRPEPLRRVARRRRDRARARGEQRGAALFVGKAAACSCHAGPNLTDDAVPQRRPAPRDGRGRLRRRGRSRRGRGHRRRARRSAELARRVQRRRLRRAARSASRPSIEGAFRTPTLRCMSRAAELHAHRADAARSTRWSRSSTAAATRRATTRDTASSRRSG